MRCSGWASRAPWRSGRAWRQSSSARSRSRPPKSSAARPLNAGDGSPADSGHPPAGRQPGAGNAAVRPRRSDVAVQDVEAERAQRIRARPQALDGRERLLRLRGGELARSPDAHEARVRELLPLLVPADRLAEPARIAGLA